MSIIINIGTRNPSNFTARFRCPDSSTNGKTWRSAMTASSLPLFFRRITRTSSLIKWTSGLHCSFRRRPTRGHLCNSRNRVGSHRLHSNGRG